MAAIWQIVLWKIDTDKLFFMQGCKWHQGVVLQELHTTFSCWWKIPMAIHMQRIWSTSDRSDLSQNYTVSFVELIPGYWMRHLELNQETLMEMCSDTLLWALQMPCIDSQNKDKAKRHNEIAISITASKQKCSPSESARPDYQLNRARWME